MIHYQIRKAQNLLVLTGLCLLSLVAALPFFLIVYYAAIRGGPALNADLFTQLPGGMGSERAMGLANGIAGSAVMTGLAALVGTPWGILMGIALNEYRNTPFSKALRFAVDLSISAPSIVIGVFVYSAFVVFFGYSAYAGALALMIIFVPWAARATEEILALAPRHIREAALALGLSRGQMIARILLPGVRPLLVTGIILSIARIAGETAPLLFTAFGNSVFARNLNEPTASLPVQIYKFAQTGFADMETLAWGGALILMGFVFLVNFVIRCAFFVLREKTS